MEDPATEIKQVIRGLIQKPTLDRQEAVLRRYFSPDCKFSHFYANIEWGGLEDVISLYQIAETAINYQNVEFHNILYDPKQDQLALRIIVFVKPWTMLYRTVELELFILLELEDFQAEDGRKLKRVKNQRDFFQRAPIPLFIPIIGEIYGSRTLKNLLGAVNAFLFRKIRNLFKAIF